MLTFGRLRGNRPLIDLSREAFRQAPSRQPSEVTNPPIPFWNEMARKQPEEGFTGKRPLRHTATVTIVFPTETYLATLRIHSGDSSIAHRDPTRVAGEVANHRAGIPESRLAENIKIATRKIQSSLTTLFLPTPRVRPGHLATTFKRFDSGEKASAKNLRKVLHRKRVVRPRVLPLSAGWINPSGSNEHMKMRVPVESTSPGMENRKKSTVHPPVVLLELLERIRGGCGESIGNCPIVHLEKLMQLLRYREDEMEMRTVGKPLTHLLRPLRLTRSQAVRTMTVAARTCIPLIVSAPFAFGAIVSQRTFPAMRHQVES